MSAKLYLERAMGIEPTALCLGSRCSTTELRPLPVRGLRQNYFGRFQASRCPPRNISSAGDTHTLARALISRKASAGIETAPMVPVN